MVVRKGLLHRSYSSGGPRADKLLPCRSRRSLAFCNARREPAFGSLRLTRARDLHGWYPDPARNLVNGLTRRYRSPYSTFSWTRTKPSWRRVWQSRVFGTTIYMHFFENADEYVRL
jgi:hypothetical protein